MWIGVIALISAIQIAISRYRPIGSALDGLLKTNQVDRFVIINDENRKTNVLTGEAAAHLLRRLGRTNRVANAVGQKSYVSGDIWLFDGDREIGALSYFPREQVLQYRGYEFRFKDTNDIAALFK